MHKVSRVAARVLDRLTEGLADPGRDDGASHRKIANGDYMPVAIERIGPDTYSIAHYGEQNGDLMADPEMVFLRREIDGVACWFPLNWRNDYARSDRPAVRFNSEGRIVGFYPREQKDQASFAATWMRNIVAQQGLNLRGKVA